VGPNHFRIGSFDDPTGLHDPGGEYFQVPPVGVSGIKRRAALDHHHFEKRLAMPGEPNLAENSLKF
jgi:hypothetical protein